VSTSPADTAQWWDDEDWKHFQKHGRELGIQDLARYDKSARTTIRLGNRFTYLDPDYGTPRVGYFTLGTGRFTALNASQTRILTHFAPKNGERYVRDELPQSTYKR
jgi:hypothetical protein